MQNSFLRSRSFALAALPLLLLNPAPRGDGGEEDDPPKGDDKARRNLENLLAKKNGDAVALAAQLLAENANLRDTKRDLQNQITDLKGKVPGEGVVILNAEQVKAWEAYQAEGTPDEFKTAKSERETLQAGLCRLEAENAQTKRAQLLRDVADEVAPGVKWKSSVLARLDASTSGLSYELKEVEENGQKAKKAFVRFKDGEGENAPVKEQALVEFAQSRDDWKDFLPALQVEQAQNSNGSRHVAQGSGGSGSNASGSVYDRIRKEAEEQQKAKAPEGKSLEERLHMRVPGTAAGV